MNCHTVESLDGERWEAALIRAIQERAQAMRREQHAQAVQAVQRARFILAVMREISEARLRAQEEDESRHRAVGTGRQTDSESAR
ncbi:MAG: hypothetical protein Q4F72_02830 [Desulfovibrionaceae bacterium]|nr:hypothetical protein [Desulfovibrionaceae bacterium]